VSRLLLAPIRLSDPQGFQQVSMQLTVFQPPTHRVQAAKLLVEGMSVSPSSAGRWLNYFAEIQQTNLVGQSPNVAVPSLNRFNSVTENGFAVKNENSMSLQDALLDTDRKRYYEGNLKAILAAVNEEGVDIRAYFAWSRSFLSRLFITSNH
jgi:hypothetical protein